MKQKFREIAQHFLTFTQKQLVFGANTNRSYFFKAYFLPKVATVPAAFTPMAVARIGTGAGAGAHKTIERHKKAKQRTITGFI